MDNQLRLLITIFIILYAIFLIIAITFFYTKICQFDKDHENMINKLVTIEKILNSYEVKWN